jgi:hypothetical protein
LIVVTGDREEFAESECVEKKGEKYTEVEVIFPFEIVE